MIGGKGTRGFGAPSDEPFLHYRHILIAAGLFVVVAFVIAILSGRFETVGRSAETGGASVSRAMDLEMQYAQPWLDRQVAAALPARPAGDGLVMQYARPWLGLEAAAVVPARPVGDGLVMQYARPWLELEAAAGIDTCPIGTGLVMQYAGPWLERLDRQAPICASR